MEAGIACVVSVCVILFAIGSIIYLCIHPPLTAAEELQRIVSNVEAARLKQSTTQLEDKPDDK